MISSNPRDTSLHPSLLQDVRLIRLVSEAGCTPSADWRASQGTTPIKNLAIPASCLDGLFFPVKHYPSPSYVYCLDIKSWKSDREHLSLIVNNVTLLLIRTQNI